jgi:membrane fusion protein
VSQELDSQRTRLESDLEVSQRTADVQQAALREKESLLKLQVESLDAQLQLQADQVTGAEKLLKRIEPLSASGVVSVFQIEQQRSVALEAQAQYKTLVRQRYALVQQLQEARQQIAQVPYDASNRRNDTERKLADVRQNLAQNEIQRSIVLRAPRAGLITNVLPTAGQAVASGQTVSSILPADSVLQAQLLVPSRSIGFVAQGSKVILRYRAFPYQKFGVHYGKVIDVSRSGLNAAEVKTLTGEEQDSNGEPLYLVKVALDMQELSSDIETPSLRPGMAVDADILMERRRLVEWAFEPLYGFHRRLGDAHG